MDYSAPFYRKGCQSVGNPTDGSPWIIQILSSARAANELVIPRTAVRGLFRSFLAHRKDLNQPPTAVGGIPGETWLPCRKDLNQPPTAVGGIPGETWLPCRKDLNQPPTAVGGIPGETCLSGRKDLNQPPTAVGGIPAQQLPPMVSWEGRPY